MWARAGKGRWGGGIGKDGESIGAVWRCGVALSEEEGLDLFWFDWGFPHAVFLDFIFAAHPTFLMILCILTCLQRFLAFRMMELLEFDCCSEHSLCYFGVNCSNSTLL